MSKVVNIVVEGQTEREFVINVLYSYFLAHGITVVRPITLATSPGFKGGDISYKRYKGDISNILRGTEDMIVTSLIDYYQLRGDFPDYQVSRGLLNPEDRVARIEAACASDINDSRFVPYIQLHEFEGLLFSGDEGFTEYFPDLRRASRTELLNTVHRNPNPELINDGAASAPSKRLLRLIPDYQKPVYGNMIAMAIGIEKIIERCPRFRVWLNGIIDRAK